MTVILSSHILAEVQQVCDHVSIIGRGRLLASGSVDEVIGESGRAVRVGLSDIEAGADLLAANDYTVRRENGVLLVDHVTDAAAVTKLLAESGHFVSDWQPVRADLESVFLQLDGVDLAGGTAMRLVRVELRRFLSRRAVVVLLLLGFLGVIETGLLE